MCTVKYYRYPRYVRGLLLTVVATTMWAVIAGALIYSWS